jgi:hypothetical protein
MDSFSEIGKNEFDLSPFEKMGFVFERDFSADVLLCK